METISLPLKVYAPQTVEGWARLQAIKAMGCLSEDTLTTLALYGAWRSANTWNSRKPAEPLADRFYQALVLAGERLPLVHEFRYSLTDEQANLFEDKLAQFVYLFWARQR